MLRIYNNKPLELLAPAGTFDIFKAIIESKCDAVYCGGQILNMRMIRKGYNLTNQELKEAISLADDRHKKVYITLNSLLEESELSEAEDYLDYLQEIKPHGLIIQDAAVIALAARKKIKIPLHSSVMMNVHNIDGIRFLEKHGVSRVVLSREMPFSVVRDISQRTNMELEYFTHGDMCVTHGSQCLYSSYLYGMSSNRGRCLKPCRWPFTQSQPCGSKPFPLAVKDLSLYSHLSDAISAGITSFKIEGRMRQKDFIIKLVNYYGDALDHFLEDPLNGAHPDHQIMEQLKKRDYSTGYAFGNPGMNNINLRGEGTGQFYSTGKMFSEPTEEQEIILKENISIKNIEPQKKSSSSKDAGLSVRVNSLEQALLSLEYKARRIYISAEPFAPQIPPSLIELKELHDRCKTADCTLFLSLPKMMSDSQGELFRQYLKKDPPFDGVLISHFGALEYVDSQKYDIVCDTSINLYNSEAINFYNAHGISGWTASLELPGDCLISLPKDVKARGCEIPGEVVLHGLPTVMYMDHDISDIQSDMTYLSTSEGRLTVRRDYWNRYHILPQKELSLLPKLPLLIEAGYLWFRVELQGYDMADSQKVLETCRNSLNDPSQGEAQLLNLKTHTGGFTYGAHQF